MLKYCGYLLIFRENFKSYLMTTPSKMVSRFIILLLLSLSLVKNCTAAIYAPNTFLVMSGGATVCQNATPANVVFNYLTCNAGTGANTGVSCTINWYYNTTNSTTVGTATLVTTTVVPCATAAFGNNFTYTPSTATPGTYYYFAVVTWAGAGTCNTAGTLAATSTTLVTVKASPTVILGTTNLCAGGNTTQLTDAITGGTWSTGTSTVATIGSASGLVTSGVAGTTTITYANGCAPAATATVTVKANPGAIAGITTVCASATTQLSDAAAGGTWSSSNTLVATVGATGIVGGGSQGTTTISYSNGCGATQTATVTVNPLPGAISGTTTICSPGSTQLSDAVSGGTWSSGTTTVASVGLTTGFVTAGTSGTATISYANGCGSPQTTVITVNSTPAAISGNTALCSGATSSLTDASTGGTWSSNNLAVASVDINTGLLTAGTSGVATISFMTACGTATVSAVTTATVTPITGNTTLCTAGATTTLSDAVTGGTWTSLNNAVASIDVNSGLVTAGANGTAQINYSNGCGTVNTIVSVNQPNAGSISGPTSVCTSGSPITLLDAAGAGVWSSSNTSLATVDGLGNVTGVAAGPVIISYSVTNTCGTAVATYPVTVSTGVSAGVIVGPTNMCAGNTVMLTDAVGGGAWSALNGNATVSPTGLLTAVSAGSETISYTVTNVCGSTSSTLNLTIYSFLTAGTISGPTSVCQGSNISLSDNVIGGVWSSTNSSVATISGLGVVNGVTAGSTTISYLVISGCGSIATTYNVTVNPLPVPGTISGPSLICTGTFAVLSDGAPGGVWSSSNTAIATVSSNIVTAVAVGSATISYTVTNGCGSLSALYPMTFGLSPNPGTITGPSSVCVGTFINLADAASGAWSTSNTTASVSSSGVVIGNAAGTAIITYTATAPCGSANTHATITVNPLPVPGAITGPTSVCIGSSTTLTDTAPGGAWSSSNTSVATVDGFGNVTSVSLGSASINYSVTNICGTILAIPHTVTVDPVPAVAAITGSANVCVGGFITLSDATAGGLWSNSNTNISIVSGLSGLVVTGLSAGSSVISYMVTNGFGCSTTVTTIENINSLPVVAAISGPAFGCVGVAGTVLSDATTGGVWSSSNASVATIDPASGALTSVAVGPVTISYTVTNISGCVTTVTFADNISPVLVQTPITGNTTICVGGITSLSNSVSGGVWSNTTGNAFVTGAGSVTGVNAGIDYVIYTVSNVCNTILDSALITINPLPSITPITSAANTICAGTTVALSDATTGGLWSSTNTAVATVNTVTGVVSGFAIGTVPIVYTVTNGFGCSSTSALSISVGPAIPSVSINTGAAATLCHGNPIDLQLTPATPGLTYQWTTGGVAIPGATDSVFTANTAATYAVIINNGTCSATLPGTNVTVAPNPVVAFTAPDILYTGSFATYQWFLNGVAITGATSSVLHETSGGAYTVVVSDGNGCYDTSAVYTIQSTSGINNTAIAQDIKIYPNPATAILHIEAPAKVNISILSIDGKLLISQKDATNVDVSALAGGMYIIMVYDENDTCIKTAKFAKSE